MPLPTPAELKPLLEDFELRFRSVLEDAWAEWLALSAEFRAKSSPRSRASIIFDSIKRLAQIEFKDDLDVRVIPKGQSLQLLVRDRVVLRFKKANSLGLGANIETQAVIEFIDPQLKIQGLLADLFKVEVCYHLNKLQTNIGLLAVTVRNRNKKMFAYELRRPATAEVVPLPADHPPAPQPPDVFVRIKKDEDSKPGE